MIWPLAINAQNSMQAVSAQGSMHWVVMRRLYSSCKRSMAVVVRIDFHWSSGKRRKVKSVSRNLAWGRSRSSQEPEGFLHDVLGALEPARLDGLKADQRASWFELGRISM